MTTRTNATAILSPAFLLLAIACGSPDEAPAAPKASATPDAPKASGTSEAPKASATPDATKPTGVLRFTDPQGWTVEKPTSNMRKAQYLLPRAEGDAEDASLVVFFFGAGGGGGRDANLSRWAGQFSQPDGSDSKKLMKSSDRTVHGMAVTDVELSGTYVAETTPGSGQRVNKENWRMLASIVEAPDGPYYIKLVGPKATVDRWEASYKGFIDALEAAP